MELELILEQGQRGILELVMYKEAQVLIPHIGNFFLQLSHLFAAFRLVCTLSVSVSKMSRTACAKMDMGPRASGWWQQVEYN